MPFLLLVAWSTEISAKYSATAGAAEPPGFADEGGGGFTGAPEAPGFGASSSSAFDADATALNDASERSTPTPVSERTFLITCRSYPPPARREAKPPWSAPI